MPRCAAARGAWTGPGRRVGGIDGDRVVERVEDVEGGRVDDTEPAQRVARRAHVHQHRAPGGSARPSNQPVDDLGTLVDERGARWPTRPSGEAERSARLDERLGHRVPVAVEPPPARRPPGDGVAIDRSMPGGAREGVPVGFRRVPPAFGAVPARHRRGRRRRQRRADPRRVWRAPRRKGPTSPPSPSSPSPAIRPRTFCSSRRSWPTTSPPWTRWRRPPSACVALVGFVDVAGDEDLDDAVAHAAGAGAVAREAAIRGAPRRLRNAVAVCAGGRGARACTTSAGFPTTACSTRSAGSRRGRPTSSSTRSPACPSGCRSARTCGSPTGPSPRRRPGGARLVVNVNASPYSIGRQADRLAVARQRVAEAGCAIAYVNQVGGQDELVFDGGSFVMDASRRRPRRGARGSPRRSLLVDIAACPPIERRPPVAARWCR